MAFGECDRRGDGKWLHDLVARACISGGYSLDAVGRPDHACGRGQRGVWLCQPRQRPGGDCLAAAIGRCPSHRIGSMDKDHVNTRLHEAMHRGSHKATEEEVAEVAAVVLAIVGEVALELSEVITDLAGRVETLEAKK